MLPKILTRVCRNLANFKRASMFGSFNNLRNFCDTACQDTFCTPKLNDLDGNSFVKFVNIHRSAFVIFYMPSCPNSKLMQSRIMDAANTLVKSSCCHVGLGSVNILADEKLADACYVTESPTIFVFYKGEPKRRLVGEKTTTEILAAYRHTVFLYAKDHLGCPKCYQCKEASTQ